jgi:tRNA-Thr(GGU) m(6)t(6)A37 methyltransferase TsaA
VIDKIEYQPIGLIRSPFEKLRGTPIQPRDKKGKNGRVELYPEYREGLDDLDGFSHIILLYHLHLSSGYKLKVVPFLDSTLRGLFSTRAPHRPNAIGLSTVKLLKIESNIIHISCPDVIDGTPLLDIKPYIPSFDEKTDVSIGWLTGKSRKADQKSADDRFIDK